MEPSALAVVHSATNGLVVAGPGAGKTELLAQRACYLLQTGACYPPRQILAISFKKDAALNLQERVRRRCGDALAKRFHSLTFDAFSKGLIDRFYRALPAQYRPSADYLINFEIQRRIKPLLETLVNDKTGLTMREVSSIDPDGFYKRHFVGRALPNLSTDLSSLEDRAASALWNSLLLGRAKSELDFSMICRLAELLVRLNPLLQIALRHTYSHVFFDEFQDTTQIQYELTRTLFKGSEAVLTAVGDSKQRIMVWAGASEKIFHVFQHEFGAHGYELVMNYRSAPRLVRIQATLVAAFEPGTVAPQVADDGTHGQGECRVMLFPDHDREAAHIAKLAVEWVHRDQINPRDICLLSRNKPGEYTKALVREFSARGVKARVETDLQDLLAEPLVLVAMDVLGLAVHGRYPTGWTSLISLLRRLRGLDESDPRIRQVERQLMLVCKKIGTALTAPDCDRKTFRTSLAEFFSFLGITAFRRLYPQYLQGTYAQQQFRNFTDYLWNYFESSRSWPQALADFAGENSIPILTVHKSKGLEYHTVVFVGLEDSALWNFVRQSDEEMRAFFVAFSRAKKRVIFTFCAKRAKGVGSAEPQARQNIGVLYHLLAAAGIQPEIMT
jgi:superfamily I DNA/RNA helicase